MSTIPPWLRKIQSIVDETQDPAACMKAVRRVVMPEHRKIHPPPPPKKRGPREKDSGAITNAIYTVLYKLSPTEREKGLPWKDFLARLEVEFGSIPMSTIRDIMVSILKPEEIPKGFFKKRPEWLPDDERRFAIFKALYEGVNIPPKPKKGS